ncbi:response regulator [Actinoplanes sp. NPDC051475]|uniref:response regulator n=1 Tax=Actinoplanes sp. NPDC051475 TaxID=3157225 RepID=UPI0034502869
MSTPRVLFVDDEPRILDGLRRSLRGRRGDWDMEFAVGAAEALELLAAAPYDVVVSDMRMPGMDGAELLTEISRIYPATARVVLSGHIEEDAIVQVAMAGHRFLTKPSDPESLTGVIDQLLLRTSGSHPGPARRIAGAIRSIPVLPGHADGIAALLSPDANLDAAVSAATHDIGLAAKLLQLSNSRFFGARPRNYSIEAIVHAMGVPMIQAVAQASGRSWSPPGWYPDAAPVLETTWCHACATARLVERLASPANRPQAQAAALLQDAGRLICLARADGEPAAAIDLDADTRDDVPFRDVAVELLHLWGVQPPIVGAVAHRDAPHRPDPSGLGVAGAVRAAHLLIAQAENGPGPDDQELALLLAHPQLQAQAVDWRKAAEEAVRQAEPSACGAGRAR